jgi:serine/threonine protein phosphatase PrpC
VAVVVADGAGGSGNGAHAAETVVRRLREWVVTITDVESESIWTEFLEEADAAMSRDPDFGESTAVVLLLAGGSILGASVGDSEAWFFDEEGRANDLTAHQRRKPLLGGGEARPVAFATRREEGTLVVGTDGLFKYTTIKNLQATIRDGGPPGAIGRRLVDLVRMPGDGLQDDVGIVVCRVSR